MLDQLIAYLFSPVDESSNPCISERRSTITYELRPAGHSCVAIFIEAGTILRRNNMLSRKHSNFLSFFLPPLLRYQQTCSSSDYEPPLSDKCALSLSLSRYMIHVWFHDMMNQADSLKFSSKLQVLLPKSREKSPVVIFERSSSEVRKRICLPVLDIVWSPREWQWTGLHASRLTTNNY